MSVVRKHARPPGGAWRFAVAVVKPALLATTRRDWRGGERIPAEGGCLLVLNHISHVDPLTAAHLVHDHGRVPRYLAKSGLFRVRFVGRIMRATGQIPVERLSREAVGAYAAAVRAVEQGEVVVVYPEGTITRDPGLWPMTGKTGAARIALATGCPVVPVGQWGAQEILAPYSHRPHLVPRKQVTMLVGEPVDLADLVAQGATPEAVARATERIMDALTHLVEEVRGERAPDVRFDLRRARADHPHRKDSA
ncbi:lysophospholipid acyltransferase family protein [Nocardioides sp. Leaf374]|uniref:lysophospholipid acyltransferase family protein n=1 Tax=Nocardioides sp. Leaf374 TaxID=2876560 RepID=UPI001E30EF5D|nr:lysophospholipid acyltransferase family protein [Nocardioides sp. Leaf374]